VRIGHDELLIGYKEIAERLECSPDTVRRWVRDDALPVFRVERSYPPYRDTLSAKGVPMRRAQQKMRPGKPPRVWTTGTALHWWATCRALGIPPTSFRVLLATLARALERQS